MERPLLSICIPTYNRASCLKQCLESIFTQLDGSNLIELVEVVISDNASSDNTSDVVKVFKEKYNSIKYFRNSENVGFDKNLLSVVEKSTGKYCLTLGDDDALFPDSLTYITKRIEELKGEYFILNCWGYDSQLKNPVMDHPNRVMDKDQEFVTLKEFIQSMNRYIDLVGNFGGMSMQLFLRESWINFDRKEQFIGTNTIHLFILLEIFKDKKLFLISKPIIKTRNDNMRWDTFPGLEKHVTRSNVTCKTVLWISDLYDLGLSPKKVWLYFIIRAYWISLKECVKSVLISLNLRK